MPTINAEYKSELEVNKLLMQSATYTINSQGENNIKYAVDTTLTSYDDSNGTLLSAETEITVSEYITFVSDKGYMILNISTEDTSIVFGTVQTKEEKTDEDISNLDTQLADIANKIVYTKTLTEAVNAITIENDIEGNQLSLKRCELCIYCPAGSTSPVGTSNIISMKINDIGAGYYGSSASVEYSSSARIGVIRNLYASITAQIFCVEGAFQSNGNYVYSDGTNRSSGNFIVGNVGPIASVEKIYLEGSYTLPIGTQIVIRGQKA